MTVIKASAGIKAVTAAVLVIGGLAAPAAAEGGFDSYMTNWRAGKESRTWEDMNNDGTNGFIQFAKCELHAPDFKVTVYKEDFGPDTAVSSGWIYQCFTGPTPPGGHRRLYFGDVAKDEYHFTVKEVKLPDPTITVKELAVRY